MAKIQVRIYHYLKVVPAGEEMEGDGVENRKIELS